MSTIGPAGRGAQNYILSRRQTNSPSPAPAPTTLGPPKVTDGIFTNLTPTGDNLSGIPIFSGTSGNDVATSISPSGASGAYFLLDGNDQLTVQAFNGGTQVVAAGAGADQVTVVGSGYNLSANLGTSGNGQPDNQADTLRIGTGTNVVASITGGAEDVVTLPGTSSQYQTNGAAAAAASGQATYLDEQNGNFFSVQGGSTVVFQQDQAATATAPTPA